MSQPTYGLLYGVEAPKGLDLYGEEGDGTENADHRWPDGLLKTWEDACKVRIARFAKRYPDKRYPETRFVPDVSWEDQGPCLLGFWVALGATSKPGIPYLCAAVPLHAVRTHDTYAKAYKRAVRRWDRFDTWAEGLLLELDSPVLWLCQTEVV